MSHINDKIDFTVEVYIVSNNKVLLRKHEKYGIWLGVGGHIELDEDPNQAAVRECKEEVDLDIELFDGDMKFRKNEEDFVELIPPSFLNRHQINETHEHIALIYLVYSKSDAVVPENDDDEWHWLILEELEKNEIGLKDDVLYYAKEALRKLAG